LITNQAIARAQLGDLDGALSAFRVVFALAAQSDDLADMDGALTNIGVIKSMVGEIDSSDLYFRKAFDAARVKGDTTRIVKQWMNLGENRGVVGDHRGALLFYDSAMILARAKGILPEQVRIERSISASFRSMGRPDSAIVHLQRHVLLKDSLLGIERVKVLTEMQEKYESEKKAKEILGLKAENLQSELDKARVKRIRNVLWLCLAFAVTFGSVFFYQRNRIGREKERSDELLHNILPEEVAAELKQKGEAEARLIDEVTVLFTDFKGFTAMSEKLGPKELVRDIHECFSAFDGIMERHGIEKIKTIGDAYMAAGGLPVPNTTHARDAVRAALEIRDFIGRGAQDKMASGLPYFEVRIGVHTGPVVAGIVGVKKFAYDIWGDTVNTASRMESSGEPGRVNISHATYLLIKDDPSFIFTSRGKVAAKGKGEVEMWFVERA
jgi:class 3 adenylate cyclase